ncbi:MAG: exonuclease SbcCD subunit D [bacterium]|nr:exonuclease SbcCD subunit D [bacterium]
MTEPIRVLHFADSHIGMENYGRLDPETGLNTRVRDFLRRMDEMIDYARAHEVDLTVFAGDAFKTRTPNPTYQREFAHRVRDLTELAPLVMLVGNHDLPPTALKASSIEIYRALNVPNVWVADDFEVQRVTTRRGEVIVGAAPYPIRSRVLETIETGGKTIAETDQILQYHLSRRIEELAEEADEYGDTPRLLTGHFTVSGAVWGSERGVMLGRDLEILLSSLADERWDYVALGHIHKHQNLTKNRAGAPPVVYSGSLERIDFGEEADPKGFCWVELARGHAEWRFVPNKARPFVTLRVDARESPTPTQDVIDAIKGYALHEAIVRVIVELTLESEAKFNEGIVRDELRRMGVSFIAAIRKEVEQPARARLGGNPEGMTDEELLERYLLSRQISQARRERLAEAARPIFETGDKDRRDLEK